MCFVQGLKIYSKARFCMEFVSPRLELQYKRGFADYVRVKLHTYLPTYDLHMHFIQGYTSLRAIYRALLP